MKWISVLAVAVFSLIICGSAWPQEQDRDLVYLSDFLKAEPYRSAWAAMLKGVKVDAWLTRYSEIYDGVESTVTPMQVDGATYRIANVCKPHLCDTNFMYVLFSPDGRHAWGLVIGSRLQWLGHPDAPIEKAITDACNKDESCRAHLH
jgi:hypothetical protein